MRCDRSLCHTLRVLEPMPVELPVLTIANAAAWAKWLARESATSKGVWLTLAKKGVTTPTSLTYAEALDEALCYGWIDGQSRKLDEVTYSHRFTSRSAKSGWSKRNVGYIARLESEGRMQPRGRLEVEKAKADGRWDAAYAGQASIEPPADLSTAIAAVPEAQETWDCLTKKNRFAICYRLGSLKTEAGRRKRLAASVDMLARGETPHPQKQNLKVTKATKAFSPTPETPSQLLRLSRPERSQRRSMRLRRSSENPVIR